jgi:glycosyltransferase involved in cell wall biosynthesis
MATPSRRRGKIAQAIGLEDFDHPYSHAILELTGSPPDLALCHNLHGGYFDLRALSALSHRVPVVMRLFDTWLFSGHCAYSLGCPRWETGCGRCPDLTLPPAIRYDVTRINWWRKRRILRGGKFFVSGETKWILDRAMRSLLAPSVLGWKLISGGIDLQTFSPGSRETARRELDLDPKVAIILYVANLGSDNPFKDFATVRLSLERLDPKSIGRRVELLVVGADGPDEQLASGVVIRRLGYIRSPVRLASLYRAADIYVHAAIEETFGNSVAEALACGTPVVVASQGGVLELVVNEHTALVVPVRQPAKLAKAFVRLLENPSLGATLGAAGATSARTRLDRQTTIQDLYRWCAEIHAAWPATLESPV